MKKIILFLLGICMMTNLLAQAPQGIPYQSIIRNGNGNLLVNQSVQVRFTIHDSTMSGNIVYQETHTTTTSAAAMLILTIGQGTSVIGNFSTINWGNGAKFMQIELDVTGGNNYTDIGTQQMMSVPYALYAGNGMKNGTTTGEMMYWNGIAWVNVAPTTSLPGNQSKTLRFCNGMPTWEDCPAVLPTVTSTAAISNISYTTASSGGSITNDGGASATARGVVWSTSSNPTVALSTKTIDGSGTGSFTSSITGLLAATTYYARAYATNNAGTAYGNQVVFTTSALTLATLTTTAISTITNTIASSGGNISLDGGAAVSARGVCWSASINPTIALSTKTIDGSGTGSFTSSIIGLAAGTTYYVRAYATNSVGTAYGTQVVFTTTAYALPTLTTTAISAITNTIASSGGNISLDGGAAVTARGVCWSTSINPTIALSTKTIDGSGIGSFTSSITGLVASTTYYVRGYATNSVGTAYGNQVVFTTSVTGIGQSYQGGVTAYILQAGDPGYDANVQHGLIVAPFDQSTGAQWGCYGTVLSGADGTGIGTGNQNTIDIINQCGTVGIAARICGNLALNGYSDWFLPSRDELNKLYLNRTAIGGFAAANYWSSSEYGNIGAWDQLFYNGLQSHNDKNDAYYVRAVRAF